ncbi:MULTISPECIES: hypothetical protein [unclassified Tolypothrix]|uniref:hypothetical protein n=1 Tax=unclassified Tolypothrix TaxID=2649714 RepID=UPI0005EAC48C|nr:MULTISPECIES: hypothetical protein [unclassified Tolypothrix]BAY88806.1 hypothetical protein NIES3275_08060 [Microchaete diplosiphon NIES-3275]EKF02789.1 hypothetical protein FDUTEX481_05589 [Tolypothrix sp. PCC 7601]MBE9083675.1 hypothetical protein [Tolypothrix sp. LEGE 11397]UYD29458.1 hypothetical protein HGR01_16405 [Tolypothrix sp. PCC 7712]UYD34632.1 hypothetical protein HG267_01905 [Tolypothrix sp. PCC 7601]
MTLPKRSSRILEKALQRASGMQAIDPNLDFGSSNSLQNMQQIIEELRNKLNAHNTALAVIDASKTDIDKLEKTLSVVCENMLMSVAGRYGKESAEYVQAGGVLKSDRIRKGTITRIKSGVEKPPVEPIETA